MQTVLITGAGKRVGAHIARKFLSEKYHLILLVNQSLQGALQIQKEAEQLKKANCTIYQVDLSNLAEIKKFLSEFSQKHQNLDVLINNAAIFERTNFEDISLQSYQRMQNINVTAPFLLCQGLAPLLKKSNNGSIINLGDIVVEKPINKYCHYGISKAAILHLSRALAVELAPDIRVNSISPGIAEFPADWDADLKRRILDKIPLKRAGTAEDIAEAAIFLAKSNYITGHDLKIDGGRSLVF